MTPVPDRSTFESIYAGQAPWDIGKPQKPFIDVADQINGSVLDAGCGTGDNALFLAGRGNTVTGIDFLEVPIQRAQRKATERGVQVTFLVKDALTFKDWSERFDNVIDSGLFHVFSDEDRRRYVDGLATILKPRGRLFLMCFSDEEPGTQGPRRVAQQPKLRKKKVGKSVYRFTKAGGETYFGNVSAVPYSEAKNCSATMLRIEFRARPATRAKG
jgi:SAM-dependent methyltransferase